MLTYEECKAIAIKRASWYRFKLTKAYKLPYAYEFNNPEIQVDGGLPFIVDARDGHSISSFPYYMLNDIDEDDIYQIDFETGERIEEDKEKLD